MGYISPQPELSVFLSTEGQLGAQYPDEFAMFYTLESALEAAQAQPLPCKVIELELKVIQ